MNSLDYIVKYLEKASSTEEKDISAICQRIQQVQVRTTCLQTTHYKTTVQREEDELKRFFNVILLISCFSYNSFYLLQNTKDVVLLPGVYPVTMEVPY